MKCRFCGCSQLAACVTEDGPCYWHRPGYCSACAERHLAELVEAATPFLPDDAERDFVSHVQAGTAWYTLAGSGDHLEVRDHLEVPVFALHDDGVYLAPHYDAPELLPIFARAA